MGANESTTPGDAVSLDGVYRILFQTSPDAIFVADADTGRILDANPAGEALLGRSRDELIGMHQTELHPPEQDRKSRERFHQAAAETAKQFRNVFVRRADGTDVPVEVSSGGVVESGGRRLHMGIFRDLSEHTRLAADLRESERFHRLVVEATDQGFARYDARLRILFANDALARITGYAREELLGMTPFDFLEEEEGERVRQLMQNNAEKPNAEYDVVMTGKDSKRIPALIHVTRLRGRGGQPAGAFAFVTDLTEHRRAETALRESEERLRQSQKMEAIGQLAGGVAHDFNNQLSGIMGYGDMLVRRLENERHRKYAENILSCARHASDLTRQLLAFSRKDDYRALPVDVHAIIHEVVQILRHSIDKRIEIRQHLDAAPSETVGDPSRIQNALLNLALNARDAMAEGGTLTFRTSLEPLDDEACRQMPFPIMPGDYLRLSVSDTGEGVDPEVRERIFEPFFTTKEAGKGTGMGLAAVYATALHHRGAVALESAVGEGSTFSLYLPHTAFTGGAVQPEAAQDDRFEGLRVLVVDDEELVRQMTADMLDAFGCQVRTAVNGEEAVDIYRARPDEIDLVLLDMVMPRLSGPDTFRALREIDPAARVLIASGHSVSGETERMMAEGAAGFLQKPFHQGELAAMLRHILGRGI